LYVIFVGLTGVHHALIAAHVFIDDLHSNNFRLIQHFGDRDLEKKGDLFCVGQDDHGALIYTFGAGHDQELAAGVIEELRNILGFDEKDLAVRAVSIPGDAIIAALGRIPAYMGGSCLQNLLGQILIAWQFERIKNETLTFKSEMESRRSELQ
jgi:hypothetical protein